MARTGFFAWAKLKESSFLKLTIKRAANRAQGGHHVIISENLPRCNMINSSWQLSDLLKGKEICIFIHSPELSRHQRWSNSPSPSVLRDLGSLDCKGLTRSSLPSPYLLASPLALQSISLSALVVCKGFEQGRLHAHCSYSAEMLFLLSNFSPSGFQD